MSLDTDKIASFWSWFVEHEQQLAASAEMPDSLVVELEERLWAIHHLNWEIGPGEEYESNIFSLSPRGDRENLKLTREIIAQAPELEGWSFRSSKPPRSWHLVFYIQSNGELIQVDGKLWEVVVYKFKDGSLDLCFKPDPENTLDVTTLHHAATIIVEGEIGEELQLEHDVQVEIVRDWDASQAQAARRMEVGLLARLLAKI